MADELVRVERPDPPAEIGVSIIKGVLGAVPVVGQALMEALFDCRSRIKQERIRPPDLSRVYLDILNEITDYEMLLLAGFYELAKSDPEEKAPLSLKLDKDRVESLGYNYNDFRISIQSMFRKGIVYDDGTGRYGARPYELIRITELGIKFHEYVTNK